MNDRFIDGSMTSDYAHQSPLVRAVSMKASDVADRPAVAIERCGEEASDMPDFHVFYCRQRTGDGIASHAPAPMPLERIAALANAVLEENGDFFGLVDDDDSVLQFIYLERDKGDQHPIRMEIPNFQTRKNLTRHISNAELAELLQNLPDRLTTDMIEMTGTASR